MFNIGDIVDVRYTGVEYEAFIHKTHIKSMMQKNPHKITNISHAADEPRYALEGSDRRWPPSLLNPVTFDRTPDWEV